ncbi:MAG: hypothetical protein COV69_00005 [Parcubacteria group bacterium CG11_big_fil_rev_8_21_14_0_20_39_14]|nr:MAG: hypothetical protein COV69_00005 [Parcubacteria group bacterium CG11_big_fil_rev_8_21_14_0_20_39_14]PIS35252.1 MAG: hypothetical protein COT36_03200 [Parcubacteria group bacterium CG08_land_8_20_14_0_20_38_56]
MGLFWDHNKFFATCALRIGASLIGRSGLPLHMAAKIGRGQHLYGILNFLRSNFYVIANKKSPK